VSAAFARCLELHVAVFKGAWLRKEHYDAYPRARSDEAAYLPNASSDVLGDVISLPISQFETRATRARRHVQKKIMSSPQRWSGSRSSI
jgi:hypothetical protein